MTVQRSVIPTGNDSPACCYAENHQVMAFVVLLPQTTIAYICFIFCITARNIRLTQVVIIQCHVRNVHGPPSPANRMLRTMQTSTPTSPTVKLVPSTAM
eukprot:1139861-Pelagomonas_calceolata.AAC.1